MTERILKPGWMKVKFGDVVKLNTDRVADPISGGIERYVGLEHITPENLHIHNWGLVTEGTTFTNLFKPGQVLFGKRRAYQHKVAFAEFEGVCSGDIYVFETKNRNKLLPNVLPFICQTDGFYEYAVGTSAGSLSPRTNWTQLAGYEFTLPPLHNQYHIANLLWGIDDTIQQYTKVLDCIQTVKNSFWEATLSPSDGTPVVQGKLTDFTVLITDGDHYPPHRIQSGIPHVVVKNIINGDLDLSDCTYISLSDYERVKKRYTPTANDLLVTCVGTIGRLALVPADFDFSADRSLIIIRFDASKIEYKFGYELFRTKAVQEQLVKLSIGSAQKHLFLKDIKRLNLSIPKIEKQGMILEQLAIFNGAIDKTRKRIHFLERLKRETIKSIWG